MESNLPGNLTSSGLPGNSPKEVAIQRITEAAQDESSELAADLRYAANAFDAVFDDGIEDAHIRIKKVINGVEIVQARLDNTLNIISRFDPDGEGQRAEG